MQLILIYHILGITNENNPQIISSQHVLTSLHGVRELRGWQNDLEKILVTPSTVVQAAFLGCEVMQRVPRNQLYIPHFFAQRWKKHMWICHLQTCKNEKNYINYVICKHAPILVTQMCNYTYRALDIGSLELLHRKYYY